jgi:hypothetical protein
LEPLNKRFFINSATLSQVEKQVLRPFEPYFRKKTPLKSDIISAGHSSGSFWML